MRRTRIGIAVFVVAAAAPAALCRARPLALLTVPALQGAIQRVMHALVFAWLWFHYPPRAHG